MEAGTHGPGPGAGTGNASPAFLTIPPRPGRGQRMPARPDPGAGLNATAGNVSQASWRANSTPAMPGGERESQFLWARERASRRPGWGVLPRVWQDSARFPGRRNLGQILAAGPQAAGPAAAVRRDPSRSARQLDHRLSVLAAGIPRSPSRRDTPRPTAPRGRPEHSKARTAARPPWRPEKERLPEAAVAGNRGWMLALRAETPVQ
jgi:hypothetical protein